MHSKVQDTKTTTQPDIPVDQFNTVMQYLLNTHAPSSLRQVTHCHHSPWYSSIALELCSMKQERRHAERRWLSTGLTIHKEIMISIKHKISHFVCNAKSTCYRVKVSTSSTVRELYTLTNNLLSKITSTPVPSAYPTDQLPQVFSDCFCQQGSPNPLFYWQWVRFFIPLHIIFVLCEHHFSSTPLCGFERVTKESVEVHEANVSLNSFQNPWKSHSPQTSLPSPRKQPQQSLSVSISSRMQHWDRFVTYCKWYSLCSGQWQHFCSSFVGSFCCLWH